MDDMSKAKIVVIISFILAIILFLRLCIFGYSRKKKFVQKAYEQGNYTEALLVHNSIYTGTHKTGSANQFPSYNAKYEYIVNGKKYYKTYHFNAKSGISAGPPYSINVYYNKYNPSKAVSNVEIKDGPRASGCYFTILITIAFAVVLYNIWKLI